MPITQERMMRVLDEARACQHEFGQFKRNIKAILEMQNVDVAIATLRVAYEMTSVPAMTQCAVERAHFSRAQRANSANAARMRKARIRTTLDAGVPSTNSEEENDDAN